MYTCTFGPKSLSQLIEKSDFSKNPDLKCKEFLDATITEATQIAKLGLQTLPLRKTNRAGRTVYQVTHFPTELVLRKAAKNITILFDMKQSNRLEIVQKIQMLCKQGVPYKVAKLDIKSFYSSIDLDELCNLLDQKLKTTPSTCNVLNKFIQRCKEQDINGVPQGISVSAVLVELYLRGFDKKLERRFSPYFLARYVDDIIMILAADVDDNTLLSDAESLLPTGLIFNKTKFKIISAPRAPLGNANDKPDFDYLGFNFAVSNKSQKRGAAREVRLDISESKINKQKTRLICSMLQFQKDENFKDLLDRMRLLTANYRFLDQRDGNTRWVGLRHQYGLIDLPSRSIEKLDQFRINLVLSGKVGNTKVFCLSNSQRKKLLSLSFKTGFCKNVCFHFSANRLQKLMKCWKYA